MVKYCAALLTWSFILAPIQLHELTPMASATETESATARYVFADGSFEVVFDRDKRMSMSRALPRDGARTPEGRIVTDSVGYGYEDCSTDKIVCADLDDYVLAVPRQPGVTAWEHNGWQFERIACLDHRKDSCERYVAVFHNKASDREGGLIFSSDHGIEMHYDSKASQSERRQIYILGSRHGLLHGGRP